MPPPSFPRSDALAKELIGIAEATYDEAFPPGWQVLSYIDPEPNAIWDSAGAKQIVPNTDVGVTFSRNISNGNYYLGIKGAEVSKFSVGDVGEALGGGGVGHWNDASPHVMSELQSVSIVDHLNSGGILHITGQSLGATTGQLALVQVVNDLRSLGLSDSAIGNVKLTTYGGVGSLDRVDGLRSGIVGPNGERQKLTLTVSVESMDAVNYLTSTDLAGFGEGRYVGDVYVVEVVGEVEDPWWQPDGIDHAVGSYKAGDYENALPDTQEREGNQYPDGPDPCFAAGTQIAMADGRHKPIEQVRVGDEVLAYDTTDENGAGALTARRVTHTFITPDRIILDFHGLRVTPGHVFLCGEGPWAGKHRMLIDILREDGSIVGADGISRRAATNCPVGSEGDRLVELAYITRAGESEHKTARIRAGTLLIDEAGEARSVLQCLEAEGYQLLEDGLVQKPGEAPGPLKFFGTPPKPEDYVLQRSGMTLAEIAGNTGYEPRPANPWGSALASGWTPDESRSGETERELFLAGTPTRNTAGETLH